MNLIINNMRMSMKAVSICICGIHLKNLDSSHSLSNEHKKNTNGQTQIQTVPQDDGATFLNTEKEIFNSMMNFGPPTPEKANVWLSELSEYSEGHGCLEKVFNDKQI